MVFRTEARKTAESKRLLGVWELFRRDFIIEKSGFDASEKEYVV